MRLVFHGIVKQGRVKFDAPERYLVHLSSFEGQRIELTLQKETHASVEEIYAEVKPHSKQLKAS